MSDQTVLVVDDEAELRDLLSEHLAALGYRVVTAESAEAALGAVEAALPDLVLTDVTMGAMSGIELCARLKADPRWHLIPVVILTAVSDLSSSVAGLQAGADDFFAKPVETVELQTRLAALLRVKAVVDQLERAEGVITTMGLTIKARDPYTGGHCERLALLGVAVGHALGVDDRTLRALRFGGFLHDIGKVAIPDSILLKPGLLDPGERLRKQTHVAVGSEFIYGLKSLDDVRLVVRHHHERWDGSGYPDGLRGEQIPLTARIMGVVDVYDALRTTRPYKAPMSHDAARTILLRELRETEAGAWEPRIVEVVLDVVSARLPGVAFV